MEYKDSIHKVNKSKVVDNVIEQMQALIDRGIWKEGDKIASEAQMSVDFNVSRVVISCLLYTSWTPTGSWSSSTRIFRL